MKINGFYPKMVEPLGEHLLERGIDVVEDLSGVGKRRLVQLLQGEKLQLVLGRVELLLGSRQCLLR